MTYELAKQLKDAGFPSKPKAWREFVANETMDQGLEVPTLSELIEACGDKFVGLDRTDTGWKAVGYGDAWFYSVSKTTEAAVAKLWLALHKK